MGELTRQRGVPGENPVHSGHLMFSKSIWPVGSRLSDGGDTQRHEILEATKTARVFQSRVKFIVLARRVLVDDDAFDVLAWRCRVD
jgi:hypothetical protein